MFSRFARIWRRRPKRRPRVFIDIQPEHEEAVRALFTCFIPLFGHFDELGSSPRPSGDGIDPPTPPAEP